MELTFDLGAVTRWLAADRVEVLGAPTGGGWSNDTVFLLVDGQRAVLRLAPLGASMFPHYDLGGQLDYMRYARGAGLAVPAILATDIAGDVLGRASFVMDHIDGQVPVDDDPPFTGTGFLFDASRDEQRHFCEQSIDAIARVHRVDAPAFATVGPALISHLDWCRELVEWAELTHPLLALAQAQLMAGLPDAEDAPTCLLWGDARPANMVVDDGFDVVGMLDWELASCGPGEFDIAWMCEMNRMRSLGMGIPPLPGFLDDRDTWTHWSAAVGRTPTNVEWHHRFAAYRVAVLLFLFVRAAIGHRRLPANHRLLHDNLATRRLAELFTD